MRHLAYVQRARSGWGWQRNAGHYQSRPSRGTDTYIVSLGRGPIILDRQHPAQLPFFCRARIKSKAWLTQRYSAVVTGPYVFGDAAGACDDGGDEGKDDEEYVESA